MAGCTRCRALLLLIAVCLHFTVLVNCQSMCDFETGLCGWQQSKQDKFDWTRQVGSTSSANTGPTSDHTSIAKTINITTTGGNAGGAVCVFPFKYNAKIYKSCVTTGVRAWCATTSDYNKDRKWGYCKSVGYYMFIEVSGKSNSDNAILLSPKFSGTKCMTLWFHMYGPHIGRLTIFTMANNKRSLPIWEKRGTQGNAWMNATFTINGNASLANYQIGIEGVRGTSYKGDISIDDLLVKDGSCDSSLSSVTCTFEKDFCGFNQVKSNDFDWKRYKGSTPSVSTGPAVDHTLGTSQGYYIYVEASSISTGQKGRINKTYNGLSSNGSCLEFYYHMFGRHHGTLNLYINPPAIGKGTPAFSMGGQQGNLWLKGQASINTTSAVIVFESIAGSGYQGDMALDDISIRNGLCQTPGECNFQNGFCTWYNLPNSLDDFDWIRDSAGTSSSFTGPQSDRFGDRKGKYVYLEASSPRRTGDKTRLVSQLFNETGTSGDCFLFYYHMYGSAIGSLNIYVNYSGSEKLVWTLSGNQNNQWKNAQVNVGLGKGAYKIIIEGVRGNSYQGDITIDDFTFKQGSCGIVPSNADPSSSQKTTVKPTTTTSRTLPPNGDYKCNFESGICKNWYQDKTDQLDWTLGKGSTGSYGTGPATDHTKKNAFGQYLYLEVSGQAANKSARLFSTQISATTGSGGKCLKFYYHMYGPNVNTLNVYVFVGTNYTVQPFWTRKGSQGNKWILGQVTLYAGQPFKAAFEATVGTSYQGDIAIDDISLSDGKCIQPSTTCTFENDLCGYTDDTGSDIKLNWKKQSLHTASTGTGPKTDHTLKSASGFYIYTEATGRSRGDIARILSPIESATSGSCLEFWYHMYGSGMGTLAVHLKKGNVLSTRSIWSEAGNKGNEWRRASVTVKSTGTYQLAFQGKIGGSYQSDMAVDDIKLTKGPCPPPGYCDFESGMCGYTNLKTDAFDWIVGSAGTPSTYTGPKFDHTTGLRNGSYIFLESSSPRKQNETALFQSEQFNAVSGGKKCLSFWYHMYGSDIGDLEVIYKVFSGSTPNKVIWRLQGQQHNSERDPWKNARVPIDMSSDHLIVFRGTIGKGYNGDIAIDDIQFTTLSCIVVPSNADPNPKPSVKPTTLPLTRPTTSAPSQLGCNFENKTFCNLQQSKTDTFNWLVKQGFTNSKGTGPSTDHTYGKGAVGLNGPGSLQFTSGKCVHVKAFKTSSPPDNTEVVLYDGCGQDETEIVFNSGLLKMKQYGMCLGPLSGATAGAKIGVKKSCIDQWTLLSNGAFQLTTSKLCMSSYRGSVTPYNNGPIVLTTACTGQARQWAFTPTMGNYAYIEASSPRKMNDTARLTSTVTSTSKCLNFFYHMHGAHINRLNVYVKNPNSNNLGRPVWSKYGSQGDKWKAAHVYLNYRGPYVYVIEAIRGNGYQGDIAIDDISVTDKCNGPLECSFEETNPPLCGFTNIKNTDQFDWSVGQGSTASTNTGPTTDHTNNNDQGKYMYIETSGRISKGSKARLQSPQYPGNGNTYGQCMQFWYHMYGRSIGELNIYILSGAQTPTTPAWTKSTDQGNNWLIGQVSIQSQSAFTVMFEGVRGASYTGDIAIDDLTMHDGPCNKPATCDFENDKCTWKNIEGQDTFDWVVGKGNTPSLYTGPGTDHTLLNGNGKYMFIEASSPRKAGDTARLVSEKMSKHWSANAPYCLRFWYHMKGSGVGTLNAYVKTGAGKVNEKLVWTLSGNQGNDWKFASAPISSLIDYQLVFEGVIGNNVQGDISLDDIVYTLGKCPVFPVNADPTYTTTQPPTTTLSTQGLLSCNFESQSTCNWIQDVSDKFNWTIHKGSTGSIQTGPSTDHTYKNATGYYMYIETSSPLRDGDNARLVSPLIKNNGGKGSCFTFWYHMYGLHVDTLNIYVRYGQTDKLIWNRAGDNGNMWKNAQVDLLSKRDYRIVIEGIRGKDYKGDISVDDIDVTDGVCPLPDLCDFEHGKCGYTDDTSAQATWTRNKGSTGSFLTGPATDHTYQTSEGYYMYTEVSSPRKKGDKFRFVSPVITDTQPYCLQFWFHMRGFHIGELNVYVKTAIGGSSLVWQRKGNHGNDWKIARVNIRPRAGRQIVFEGVRGSSYMGDIAIDDLKTTKGYCPPPGDCTFEKGMCSYRNVRAKSLLNPDGDDFDWVMGSGGTPSLFTGPSNDHTTGTKAGNYIFIEASSGRNGDKAQIISEDFYPTYGRCVQFWAHMKGAGIGSLNVYIRGQNDTSATMRMIWSLSGQQAAGTWFSGQAPVASLSDYQIVFEATQTNSYAGDIALDDITYTNFKCQNNPTSSVPPISTTAFPTRPSTTIPPTLAPNQYTCNFTNDKCNWMDDASANFNWTRAQGGTASSGTGPSADHTVGASGWYAYIETSWPRKQNETARLMSDYIPATSQMCFDMWYHMYGDQIANLTIYTKTTNGMTTLWHKSGTQGQRWKHATIDISSATQFRVVIEGQAGLGYRGDIAIDDLHINYGPCPPQAECTFEDPKLCGWSNSQIDNFDWSRDNAGTSSTGTGPSQDHTYGTAAGYYMYIEASSPRTKGHKSWLQSKTYTPSLGRCLSFWYHMYGQDVGSLNILTSTSNTSFSAPVWTLSGNQGNIWRPSRVTIRSASNHRIIFEGKTGKSYRGDIAIDDVKITDGPCPDPGNCDFERDLCGYTNTQYWDQFDWQMGQGTTASVTTGPTTDHSTGTNLGRYLFIESSWPRQNYDRATLVSETVPTTGDGKCVHFWYHMKGDHIGELAVFMNVGNGLSQSHVWELQGDQSTGASKGGWKQGQAPLLSRGQNLEIHFVGIRGSGYKGDIAIDDITVVDYDSGCAVQPRSALPSGTNFEVGLNRWTQSKTDQFDWTRHRGHTGSIGTGPVVDHTSNKTTGYYMYIETSFPRQPNETAALVSPMFRGNGTKYRMCLWFAYHMYGQHVDTLRVYTKSLGLVKPTIWQRKGSQGPNWRHGEAQFDVLQNTQVIIEGKRGTSYKGDIAIDDLEFFYGDCRSSGTCTFESPSICGWYVDTSTTLKWQRQSGSTLSSRTGPANDHTYGTSRGHYMFIETSVGGTNSLARMYSTWSYSSGQQCVQFFYSMYGKDIGSLSLYVSYSGSRYRYRRFYKSGNQNNTWIMGQATVNKKGWFHMTIEARRGNGPFGDIAVDDFRIRDGACPAEGDCDFEHLDFCSWSQESGGNDTFDWMIGSGRTGSYYVTGPTTDHTTNSAGGYYAFIESSSPRVPGDKAILKSVVFPATSASGGCFKFWYHMKGASIGDLKIYIRKISSNAQVVSTELMWMLSGNKGTAWKEGRVPLKVTSNFQVLIEAVRGSSFGGDVAVDDLQILTSSCGFMPADAWPKSKPTPTAPIGTSTVGPTTGNSGKDCNFDQGICPSWKTNSTKTHFVWKLHKGSTGSTGTGPKADHTQGTDKGSYVYIETSYPAQPNDTTTIYAVNVPDQIDSCMNFWYHMYGPHVGTLNVYLIYNGKPTLTWKRIGTQGDEWKHGQVEIPRSTKNLPLNIAFEGIRGSGYAGDIALDDISIAARTCPAHRECTFETIDFSDSLTSLCGWSQVKGSDQFDWTKATGSTASVRTGPKNDHTYNTASGHYLYIETSYPRKKGDTADIVTSNYYTKTPGQCFTFWYHMFGSTIGNLTLFMRTQTNGKNVDTPLWSKAKNEGNMWRRALVTLKSPTQFKLMFRGTVGSSYTGDIAIDDILLKDGLCPLPGDCTFEDFQLCTFSQGANGVEDDFDWLRGNGGTSSWKTGPTKDSTKGDASGHYMYIETSAPRKTGDKARLISQMFPATSSSYGRCLKFYRHMFGAHIGTFNVYIRQDGKDTLLWSDAGNQGDVWIPSQAPVYSSTSFRLVFEAVRGSSFTGDIALDDINFNNNFFPCSYIPADAAPPTLPPTTITPVDSNCTFDAGTICRWEQSKSDNFDWTIIKGRTGSYGTGPLGDHTSGTGQYIYIESSSPRKPNETAVLRSPKIRPQSGGVCFWFAYHMHGSHIGTLNIYKVIGNTRTKIWTRSGTQGNRWRNGQVNIRGVRTIFKIEVEAIRGTSYAGDISLDDFTLKDGWCGTPKHCDFENSKCYFKNYDKSAKMDDFDWKIANGGTPSLGTGPTTDHTTGTALGNFFFIETSWPQQENDTAIIYSKRKYSARKGQRCFNFWYHMSGAHIGSLNIYIDTPKSKPIWSKSGNQGNLWRHGSVTIGSKTNYRVLIEGVRGSNYKGDIAIDDVWVEDYACPLPGSCDFESQSFCTWSQAPIGNSSLTGYDDFDWQLLSGSTPSFNTGPKVDHTKGTSLGTYAYIEVSGIRPNKTAKLISETFKATKGKCLSFWFHMLGQDIGQLNFYMIDNQHRHLVKTIDGDQGSQWQQGEIGLHSQLDFHVVIEAVHGSSYRGDIALDDINVVDGNCVGMCSSVQPTARVLCGPSSVTAASCVVSHGCCYDDTIPNVPKCYQHPSTCKAVPLIARTMCGYKGISSYMCGRMGCCYDATSTNMKCYNPLSKPTDFPFTLRPRTTEAPPSKYDCNFDKNLCGFKNMNTGDNFNWRRQKGSTGSWGTGPKADHTLGDDKGAYAYIETSYVKANSTANMLSPKISFPVTSSSQVCVRFWYHMFGQHVGAFNIFVTPRTTLLPKKPIWQRKGSLLDEWTFGQFVVTGLTDFYVVFQGIRGSGYQGDIAIDDVGFVNGPCPATLSCGFENPPDKCGWVQDASDDFDWSFGTGNTTSISTGPKSDRTYQTAQGHYMFIEASWPRNPGDKARLESFEHAPTTGSCFEFYYNMYGDGIGTLNIYIRRGNKVDPKPLWTMSGDEGRQWYRGLVTVVEDRMPWKLIFEGIRGGTFNSDIAIDELQFFKGKCVPRGDCDFEGKNACGYENDPDNRVDWLVYSGSTPSYNTGPRIDHTTGLTTGTYLYMEASAPARRGDTGMILSEVFKVNPNFKWCVEFYYHMFGDGVGKFSVQRKYLPTWARGGNSYYANEWSIEGNRGDIWHYQQVNLSSSYDFQIAFKGEVGSGVTFLADIAIDDIVVRQGLCPAPTPPPTPNPCLRRCKNNMCVPSDKVCDFYPDCAQGTDNTDDSDEHGCDGCDFENGTCYWQDSSNGLFKWSRKQGSTPSIYTGPSTDHTKGTSAGFYTYVEASVGNSFDLATLVGPTVKQSAATCKMTFWYHMYGSNIGELSVYVVHGYRMTKRWSLGGDQGNKWKKGTVYINRQKNPFHVKLTALRQGSYRGDIAIDDLKFENCPLPSPASFCYSFSFRCIRTRTCIDYNRVCDYTDDCGDGSDEENCQWVHYPYRCDFEHSFCAWDQMTDDDFDFTRASGLTDSTGTGPLYDHTVGTTSGHYIYAEASWPRKKGDVTRISSPFLSSSYFCNFRFYYHMTGYHIGTLRVKMRNCLNCTERLLWSRDDPTAENTWIRKYVYIYSDRPFQIIVEAEIGDGFAGDIAVDDVSFDSCQMFGGPIPTAPPTTTMPPTTPPCPSNQFHCSADSKCIDTTRTCDYRKDCSDGEDEINCGSCSFENDMCGYTDESIGTVEFKRTQPRTNGKGGPTMDATNNSTKGWFMLSEKGGSTINNDAIFSSHGLSSTAPQCMVQFSYFTTNSTSIQIGFTQDVANSTLYSQLAWLVLDTKSTWKTLSIPVGQRPNGWKLKIRADKLNVAIDDVTFVNCAFAPRTTTCKADETLCQSRRCIDKRKVCDFVNNCGDNSDENPVSCVRYKDKCNFEVNTCDWYQDRDDQFDWTRAKGYARSVSQRPSTDNTKGTSNGFYMYVMGKGYKTNETARLYSNVFDPTDSSNGKTCSMRFYYHLHGNRPATLLVKLKTSAASGGEKVLWKKSDDEGSMWNFASISIDSSATTFQIAIEVMRSTSTDGDISIDDISFTPSCQSTVGSTLSPNVLTPSPPPGCKSGQFSCGNGQCIDATKVCDFTTDCGNKKDEEKCPASCDFEDGDGCKWSNAWFYDIMDWTVHKASTPSNGTGPSADNTLKTSQGHYLYMEADQFKYTTYPNAHYVSPMYYKGAYNCKFTFYYNMWHYKQALFTDVRLNVLYRRGGRDTVLWSRQASTFNKWNKATVQLPKCPQDFRLVFEGLHYYNSKTDAAIDDWKFDCAEPANPVCNPTTQLTCGNGQCISRDDLCDNERNCCDGSDEDDAQCKGYTKYDWQHGLNGWAQLANDSFDFSLYSGQTPSSFTGPRTDHTTQEEHGRYLYVEASGRSANDSALLGSPTIAGKTTLSASPCTMSFWYHMRGLRIGTLSVYTTNYFGELQNNVWSRSRDQGNDWQKGKVQLNSQADFQVIFEATIGSSFAGDIAIDDVIFSSSCVFNGKSLPGAPTVPPNRCAPNFPCGKTCLSRNLVCDFAVDCADGSDEAVSLCGNPQGFEKNTMGAWKNSGNVAYIFTLQQGATPSGMTGPTADARNDSKGYYAYLETSKKNINRKATMMSPTYAGSFSECVMEFYYHMSGQDIGILEVDLQPTELGDKKDQARLFELRGDQGDEWKKTRVYIGRRKTAFSVNFTATVGTGHRGDIAIDEISFANCSHAPLCPDDRSGLFACKNGRCIPSDKICDITDDCGDGSDEDPSGLCSKYHMCTFENLNITECHMIQDLNDNFNWTYNYHYTLSYNTGPTRDHTYGTIRGHYYYIEASLPRKAGDVARMFSIPIQAKTDEKCELRFFYHMFGKHVDALKVFMLKVSTGIQTLKFEANGDYGDMWKLAEIDLSNETEPFRMVFEGTVGKSYRSDIAIDDFILSAGCAINGTRIQPTMIPCKQDQLMCRSSHLCLSNQTKCDGISDCKDGSDEENCPQPTPTTGKRVGDDEKKASVSILAAGVVGGIILLLVVIIVLYLVMKRRREKKLQLFSVFYDPNKEQEKGGGVSSTSKATIKDTGVSNPVYDEQGDFSMGDLDTSMFPDTSFDATAVSKGDGATSMVNPLYQDPYMEDDDSPLSNF